MSEKRCTKCGEVKPLEAFHRQSGSRDGRRPECKVCNLARQAAARAVDPEANRRRVREWQAANPEKLRAKSERFAELGKKRVSDRKSYLKRTYGLTVDDYDRMLESQGGGCAICGRAPRNDIALHVDHCHHTGAIRGLLCFRCNNALGDLDHDLDLFRAAVAYLEESVVERVRARVRAELVD